MLQWKKEKVILSTYDFIAQHTKFNKVNFKNLNKKEKKKTLQHLGCVLVTDKTTAINIGLNMQNLFWHVMSVEADDILQNHEGASLFQTSVLKSLRNILIGPDSSNTAFHSERRRKKYRTHTLPYRTTIQNLEVGLGIYGLCYVVVCFLYKH